MNEYHDTILFKEKQAKSKIFICYISIISLTGSGHGGEDPGATFFGRREKDDVLNLALAVGNILADRGVNVVYTRVNDTYDTPFEKAVMANNSGADIFVSLHRNAMPFPGTSSGIETLVYQDAGVPAILARNINRQLTDVGFQNRGVIERPNLVVLRRTQMPAVLVEVGFIDHETDNRMFDQSFPDIAEAIAAGIMETLQQEQTAGSEYYQVQTASYTNRGLAEQLVTQLQSQGFPAFIVYEDGLYKVRVGAFLSMDEAAEMERNLRRYGYHTLLRAV